MIRATAAVHLDALHQLTTSSGCPPPALQIAGFSILRLLATEFVQKIATETQCNLAAIREKVHQAIGSTNSEAYDPSTPKHSLIHDCR